jgi:hypothetical protein
LACWQAERETVADAWLDREDGPLVFGDGGLIWFF